MEEQVTQLLCNNMNIRFLNSNGFFNLDNKIIRCINIYYIFIFTLINLLKKLSYDAHALKFLNPC